MSSRRGEVVLAGYLTKSPPESRSAVSQWRRRWFVLADSKIVYPLAARYVRFEYYSSEEDAKTLADPKGVINLQVCNKVVGREPLRGHKYVFDVCTSERVYHLNAENAEEKDAWISTLCRLLFGSESSSGAGGGVGGNSAAGASPLPPHPSDLYVANSTYSDKDFRSDCETVPGGTRDSSLLGASRPLPPPPTSIRREAKSLNALDDSHLHATPPKEEVRKSSTPTISMHPPGGVAKGAANVIGQEEPKKPLKQPPKVMPYKQHKKACADYETMEEEEAPPPPPKVAPRRIEARDGDYSVVDEAGPPIPSRKKPDNQHDDYSYLRPSPPPDGGEDLKDYSHLDLSLVSVTSSDPNAHRDSSKEDDNYSHLNHF